MSRLYSLVLVCFVAIGNCQSAKIKQIPPANALNFMKTYGYLQMDVGDSEALYSEEGISDVLKVMQKYGGIEETGIFDENTKKLLTQQRCGVPDILRHTRKKRYALGPNGWEKRNISYYLDNWSPQLGEDVVHREIEKALNQWGAYGRLNFHRKDRPDADIIVKFASGSHDDGILASFPFDGPGGVVAHAFFPNEYDAIGGDIHFDADETWSASSSDTEDLGTNFYAVALHELGHSLGLAHSPDRNSIMFPYYQNPGDNGAPLLGQDDILAMYELYIRRTLKEDGIASSLRPTGSTSRTRRPTTTESFKEWFTTQRTSSQEDLPYPVTPTYRDKDFETEEAHKNNDRKYQVPKNSKPSIPNICDGHVDAIATLRNELFVFRDSYLWRFRERGILMEGYPIKLRDMFPSLPESIKKIDAAYERPSGAIVLFTGSSYWIYDGNEFLPSSPESLTHLGLPEYVTSLDAVQNWSRNKKTYFYSQDRFWRYDETSKRIDPGYPQHMNIWRGVPLFLDSATTWKDGYTYFFKDGLSWKFNNNWIMVSDGYPMPTPTFWFGCPEANNVVMNRFLRNV